MTLTKQDAAHVPPTVAQLHRYTGGGVCPRITEVQFRPGGGRGRPPKGREAIVATDIEQVQRVLREGTWHRYRRIVVRFAGDCHEFAAQVERVNERLMLTVLGVGVLTSVRP
jgi:hypothetical protein